MPDLQKGDSILFSENVPDGVFDILSTDNLKPALQERRSQLMVAVEAIEADQAKNYGNVAGRLRIDMNGRYARFFRVLSSADFRGEYIPRKKRSVARALAQKDYNANVLEMLRNQLQQVEAFLSDYNPYEVDEFYEALHSTRRSIVQPVRLSDEDFVRRWLAVTYERKSFAENSPEFYSADGLRVRSKSEVIIADTLTRLRIPFRYEFPLKIKGLGVVHPDFICLDVRRRRTVVWEHFGMMDNPDYALRAVHKMKRYREAGFNGGNFITTFESTGDPLSSKDAKSAAAILRS